MPAGCPTGGSGNRLRGGLRAQVSRVLPPLGRVSGNARGVTVPFLAFFVIVFYFMPWNGEKSSPGAISTQMITPSGIAKLYFYIGPKCNSTGINPALLLSS